MHVEIDDRHPLKPVFLPRVNGADGDIVIEAEAHGAIGFGVMSGRPRGTEGVCVRLFHHRVNGGDHRARGSQRRIFGARRHEGIRIEIDDSRLWCPGRDQIEMGRCMGEGKLFARRHRSIAAFQHRKIFQIQLMQDSTQPIGPFRMPGTGVVKQAIPMGEKIGRHAGFVPFS